MRRSVRALVRGAIEILGRSIAAPLVLRAVISAARQRLQPRHRLERIAELIAGRGRSTTVLTTIELPSRTRIELACDLRFQGYRELALAGQVDELSAKLFAALAPHADVTVDVGANAGVFSYVAAAAAPNTRVIAFEPAPALATALRRNAAHNGWSTRLDVRDEVVGEQPGTVEFFVLATDFESTADPEKAASGAVREVLARPVTTVDAIVDASGVSPDRILLKIDVEGYESAVIAGAHRTLRAARPPQLIIEFLTKALKSGAIESMVALGYDVWYVAPDRLVSVRTMADFARHQHLGSWNFYCTKNPRADIDRLAATLGIAVS